MRPHPDQKRIAVVVYLAAMFMAILDTTIVNVALPTIGRDLQAPADEIDLVSVAYLVSLAVFIPASSWLGDRIGPRRALVGAIGVFTVASALCGLATSFDELVAARILQGMGAAVMTPVGLALLFRLHPPAERVRVASLIAAVTTLAPALGPILGGLFTTDATWRLVFFVNLPVGALGGLVGVIWLADHAQPHPGRLDVPGFVLSGLGLGALMYGVSAGASAGWGRPVVWAALLAGGGLLAAAVVVELRAERPLLDLRLFADRMFALATGLYALGSVAYLGALFLAALFLQDALGASAIATGLIVCPSALGVLAGGQLVSRRLYPRLGPRRPAVAGLGTIAAALAMMALVTGATNPWLVRLVMFVLGLGVAGVFISAQASSMATIGRARTASASAIFNAGKQLGGAIGVALVTTVLSAGGAPGAGAGPTTASFHLAFLAAAAVAGLTIPLALAVRDEDAASTMTPRRPRRPRHGRSDDRRAGLGQLVERAP